MITLNIKKQTRELIQKFGYSLKLRDDHGNYFGSELRIFFSKNPNSKLAVIDYDLPRGAGSNVTSISILDANKSAIYRSYGFKYSSQKLDDFLLS